MSAITPDSPVASVFGRATKKRDAVINGLGLETVGDLLAHFPRRYVKTEELSDMDAPAEGQIVSVVGEVTSSEVKSFKNRRTNKLSYRVEVRIKTNGPGFTMSFFVPWKGQAEKEQQRMARGNRGMFTGKAQRFNQTWQIASPHSVMFTGEGDDDGLAASLKGLLPIYPVTATVYSWDEQKAVQAALDLVSDVPDVFPEELREQFSLLDVSTALRWIHAPDDYQQVGAARKRFRFEEALVTQLVLARRRAEQRALGARARTGGGGLLEAFDARLPFELTRGQQEVGEQVEADLARDHPMHRLLQGEVGSGKTVVALRAMLAVVDAGGQAALLAPTEVLAQQHHRSISAMLGPLAERGLLGGSDVGTRVALLTGSQATQARRTALLDVVSGDAGIVVGTHALIQEHVGFADLGLVVVDEQHRFGVEQRDALRNRGELAPHMLVMTATPIPRTVAMTVYGDLEVSALRELPRGRSPIATTVVPLAEKPSWFDRVWRRVHEEVAAGHQAYVVCPRVGGAENDAGAEPELVDTEDPDIGADSDDGQAKRPPLAVLDVAPKLADGALHGLRIGVLHGKLPPDEKDAVMRAFERGELDVLVATTVIEVGVDVPNATGMVILDADRFGLSQLHQLRGRVGRGSAAGVCLLVTEMPAATSARERLDAVAGTTDGFELARMDLELRREGDVLGAIQS
ncbi:MAG: ATP-dependent DNA helicase RecG, partial [Nocardioides sp.]